MSVKKNKKGIESPYKKYIWPVLSLVFLILLFAAYQGLGVSKWKDLQPDKLINTKQTTIIYDADNKPVADIYGTENRIQIKISELPKYVKMAFVSAEDTRFYSHSGIDIKRIVKSTMNDIKAGSYKEGASTISQQLIKNSHLTNDKTIMRKIQEVFLAWQLEQKYSKDQIMEMYLNYIYFGNGAYGIETAANTYFGKKASELTVGEAAMLAGIIKYPAKYAPHIHYENSIERRNLILSLMYKNNDITAAQYTAAKAERPAIQKKKSNYPYGYYTDMVIEEASKKLNISIEELISGGYRIYSTLDPALQQECERVVSSVNFYPKASDGTYPEGCMIVLDNTNGAIKAVVGGREHTAKLSLNRALSLPRQPGSTIKPLLVYGPGLEDGIISAAQPILDAKTSFSGYQPSNFNGLYNGWVTVRQALVKSLNIPAVKVMQEVGLARGKSFAERLGIHFEDEDNNLAIALGGMYIGTTPAEIANAYQAYGNNGVYIERYCIRDISDYNGKNLFRCDARPVRVMSEDTAYLMSDILQDAVKLSSAKLKNLGFPIAAKTGTVGLVKIPGFSDAWIASYNPQYTVVARIGFDKTDSKHYLPQAATGSNYPAAMCKEVFAFLYNKKEAPAFQRPSSVVTEQIDLHALNIDHKVELATSYTPIKEITTELFSQRHLPTAASEYYNVPTAPEDVAVDIQNGLPLIRFTIKNNFVNYVVYRRSAFGQPAVIAQLKGPDGQQVSYLDKNVTPGEICEYYVVPEHSQLKFGTQALAGTASRSISVIIPYDGLTESAAPLPTESPSPSSTITPLPSPTATSSPSTGGSSSATINSSISPEVTPSATPYWIDH